MRTTSMAVANAENRVAQTSMNAQSSLMACRPLCPLCRLLAPYSNGRDSRQRRGVRPAATSEEGTNPQIVQGRGLRRPVLSAFDTCERPGPDRGADISRHAVAIDI